MFVSMQLSSHQISFLIIKLFNQCTDNIKLIFFVHKILSFANIKIFLIGIIFPYQLEALHRKCWRIRQTEIFHILVRVKSFMVRGKAQQCTIFGSISGYQIFVTQNSYLYGIYVDTLMYKTVGVWVRCAHLPTASAVAIGHVTKRQMCVGLYYCIIIL